MLGYLISAMDRLGHAPLVVAVYSVSNAVTDSTIAENLMSLAKAMPAPPPPPEEDDSIVIPERVIFRKGEEHFTPFRPRNPEYG